MFGHTTQPDWFFESSVHLEAVSRLLYLVDSHEPFGAVFGPDGSGRTRVLNKVREELLRTGVAVVSMNLAGLDQQSALWQLSDSIGRGVRSGMNRYELLSMLRDELSGRGHCGVQTVVLLDDVHRAADDVNPLLRLLVSLHSQCKGLLTLIVACDRHLNVETANQALVRVCLPMLDAAESSDFVRSLARRYSIRRSALDESAVKAVSEAARGNTARIEQVCELLRVVHQATPHMQITGETVQAILEELLPIAMA